jgi:hypothetical protein
MQTTLSWITCRPPLQADAHHGYVQYLRSDGRIIDIHWRNLVNYWPYMPPDKAWAQCPGWSEPMENS